MIRRVLALGGISIAITFGQPPAAQSAATEKNNQLFAYDVKIDPNFKAPKTPWGEPDLQGIWPLNHLIRVGLQRNKMYGDRLYKTDEEVSGGGGRGGRGARGGGRAGQPNDTPPVADTSDRAMRQTSLIIDPPDGQFPALTDYGKKLQAEMKSSYRPGQTVFDSVDDFAAWDRCITRGMPVSMEPRNYNNGIRIMQSPGYVVILLEMAHEARVIPTSGMPPLASNIKEWMGESRGHWEGNTLVVVTTNYNGLVGATSAGVPQSPGPLQPETPDMKTTEWFTRVADDTIEYKMKIEDPAVLATGSYTIGYPMFLDNKYQMFEYSCHEGNIPVRDYIETSRYERAHPKEKKPDDKKQ
ncbi:MAG TPA: hypothetical protein VGG72_33565 [Bryobacteraceae bacterium]|jgi:hypothetical protein